MAHTLAAFGGAARRSSSAPAWRRSKSCGRGLISARQRGKQQPGSTVRSATERCSPQAALISASAWSHDKRIKVLSCATPSCYREVRLLLLSGDWNTVKSRAKHPPYARCSLLLSTRYMYMAVLVNLVNFLSRHRLSPTSLDPTRPTKPDLEEPRTSLRCSWKIAAAPRDGPKRLGFFR